jgi:mannosyltransferase OCH1-like enzyme
LRVFVLDYFFFIFDLLSPVKMLHQTWKDDDVGEEADFKAQMDDWSRAGDPWAHLVWTDKRLNQLMAAVAPWVMPVLRRMRPNSPVDKIDTMRYLLLFFFGGVYMDADQVVVELRVRTLGGGTTTRRWNARDLTPRARATVN